MFSFGQIAVCAAAGGIASTVVVLLFRRSGIRAGRAVVLGLVVALSILAWRSAANTASLNDDPIAFVSPNDVLCPVITYVCLGLYAAARRPSSDAWPMVRLLLTGVSLIVNVVTI